MNTALAVLLATPLIGSFGVDLTFEDMLDSAQIVVIGRVDSIWYTLDTTNATINCKPYQLIGPWTHISAEVLALYVKGDSLPIPENLIHIVEQGGVDPDGTVEWIEGSCDFKLGEVFLAAVEDERNRWLHSATERLYVVPTSQWKYTISGDSVWIMDSMYKPSHISLADVTEALSTHFIKAY